MTLQAAGGRGTAVLVHFYRDWGKNDHEKIIGSRLAHAGFDVKYMACTGELAACDRFWFNVYQRRKNARDCTNCQNGCRAQEAKLPGTRVTLADFVSDDDRREIARWAADLPMSQWASATFDGLPVGHWSTSSLGTHLRVLPVRVDDWTHVSVARDVLHATATAIRAARRFFAEVQPSLAVVFNGRFSPTRAFLEVARASGVPVMCYEVGDRRRADCRLMPGFGIGERGYWDALATLARKQPLEPRQADAVAKWVSQRFHDTAIPRYAATDTVDGDPWPAGSPRILVVPSSNDENREADGFDRPGFSSQIEILDWLTECARVDPSAAVVVRAHPNLALSHSWGPSKEGIRLFADFAGRVPRNVRVIQPTDPDSSYSFLRGADLVVSDFSLMTLEAAALGIPVLALGRSRYWETECFYRLAGPSVRPWAAIAAEARRHANPTTVARARRCLWNMFLGGEFPADPASDSLGRAGLGDAIERWATTREPWWNWRALAQPDAPPLTHEVADLSAVISGARPRRRPRQKSAAEVALMTRARGATRRVRRAARALLGR